MQDLNHVGNIESVGGDADQKFLRTVLFVFQGHANYDKYSENGESGVKFCTCCH